MLKRIALFLFAFSLAPALPAQNRTITPNYKDADLGQIVEAVSEITGKNFIIDPRVRGVTVNMIAQTPMSPDAFYEAFLSILQVNNLMASPAGSVIKIVPDANARQLPGGEDLPRRLDEDSDEFVTHVIAVKNLNPSNLVPLLRPMVSTPGQFVAVPPSTIIISDRANNVARMIRIIQRIDQTGDDEIDRVVLQNASAAEIVRVVNQLFPTATAEGGMTAKVVADDRTNSVLISGEKSHRLRLKVLAVELDTPLESGGNTRKRYLQFAEAEKVAAILKDQATATVTVAGGPPAGPAAAAASQGAKDVTILADPDTNLLIITAPPKVQDQLWSVVDALDIRRAQVLVEAVIVDVSLNKSAELGVNWAVFSDEDDTRIPAGGFISPIGGVTLVDLVRAIDDPSSAINAGLASGTTVGVGRVTTDGVSFAAMLRALRSDENSNVVAFPQQVTMDNEEAELKVTREVPFITGQFTNTGGNNNGSVNPFQTIQREEVGTILKVTPQISEGGSTVTLKIELESSDVLPTSAVQGAVDLATSKRTINTRVMIEDGGIVVLGGLISQNYNRQESRVPFLGRIPLIGLAFKTRSGQNNRTNLMLFIRTKILRDERETAIETNSKYNYIREEQRKVGKRELLPILPGTPKPLLPELDEEQKRKATEPPENKQPESTEEPAKTTPLPPEEPPGRAEPPPPPPPPPPPQ